MSSPRFRPGRIARAAVAIFGVIFMPFSIWFAWSNFRRNWPSAVALFLFSIAAFRVAFDRRDDALLSKLDDL